MDELKELNIISVADAQALSIKLLINSRYNDFKFTFKSILDAVTKGKYYVSFDIENYKLAKDIGIVLSYYGYVVTINLKNKNNLLYYHLRASWDIVKINKIMSDKHDEPEI